MSLKRRFEGEVEIHEGAADLYHDMFKSKPHNVSSISPHFIQACDLHHGNFGTPGSLLEWKYSVGGKQYVAKTVIEKVDDENKVVSYRVTDGDLLKEYKSMVSTCQVIPKGKGRSIAKWILEYEKYNPNTPEPSALLDVLLDSAKDAHDHHECHHLSK